MIKSPPRQVKDVYGRSQFPYWMSADDPRLWLRSARERQERALNHWSE